MMWTFILMGAVALIPDYKSLTPFSTLGVAAVAFAMAAFTAYSVVQISEHGPHPVLVGEPTDMFKLIGVVFFDLTPAFSVVPIQSQMTHKHEFYSISTASLLAVSLSYLVFGVVASLAYGDNLNPIFTLSLVQNHFTVFLTTLGIVNVLVSFPIQLMPVNVSMNRYMFGDEEPNLVGHLANRLGWPAVALAIAVLIPDFGAIVSVLGGVGAGMVGATFPSLYFLSLYFGEQKAAYIMREKLKDSTWSESVVALSVAAYGVIGIGLAVSVTYSNVALSSSKT